MIIVFDIGGTHTRVARSSDGKTLGAPMVFDTPVHFTEGVVNLVSAMKKISDGEKIDRISGGVAGVSQNGKIINSPNLPGWNGGDLKTGIAKEFPDAKISIENDASLAALGEAVFDTAAKFERVAYFTISTGVGGGLVVGRKIAQGVHNFEPGHQILDTKTGATLESLASGTAIVKKYGKKISEINDTEILQEIAHLIATGIHNTNVLWSPDIFILGGAVILNKPELIGLIETALKNLPQIYPFLPQIKIAALGDLSTLFGALSV